MIWTDYDTWIVVTAAAIAMACALPGLFLFLNRDSMMGDAISHGILPGLAIAFLISGTRDSWVMLFGAVCAGLLTMLITSLVRRYGQVESGASLGVAFCFLFALGLVLIRTAADTVELDPDTVLYGAIETSVMDAGPVPSITILSLAMLVMNAVLTVVFYKELRLAIFDPAMASALGFNAERIRQGLVVVTSVTTVVAFQSVGSILVIAMLVVPAAVASMLTPRLGPMLVYALLTAAISAVGGYLASIYLVPPLSAALIGNGKPLATSAAGSIVVAAGAIFAAVLIAQAVYRRALRH
ncbi:MAG: metal ABC transporter permease [Verrucomicrobiota bacterium]